MCDGDPHLNVILLVHVILGVRAAGHAKRESHTRSDALAGGPAGALRHRDCLAVYFRQAKLLWSSGTLTRRDRALLDQLRVGLHLTITEAARLESTAARMVATAEELAAQDQPQLLRARPKPGPWLLGWHLKHDQDPA